VSKRLNIPAHAIEIGDFNLSKSSLVMRVPERSKHWIRLKEEYILTMSESSSFDQRPIFCHSLLLVFQGLAMSHSRR